MSLQDDLIEYRQLKEKQIGALEHDCLKLAQLMNKRLNILSKRIDRSYCKEEIRYWRV